VQERDLFIIAKFGINQEKRFGRHQPGLVTGGHWDFPAGSPAQRCRGQLFVLERMISYDLTGNVLPLWPWRRTSARCNCPVNRLDTSS